MKKYKILIVISFIMAQFLIGCSANNIVEFKEFHAQVMAFSESNQKSKPIQPDAILMIDYEDFEKFKFNYFTSRQIPTSANDKEKAVLFLQIPSDSTHIVNNYQVESMNVRSNILTVTLKKKASVSEVDTVRGFNGTLKWVMLIEVDKAQLKEDMKIVVKK